MILAISLQSSFDVVDVAAAAADDDLLCVCFKTHTHTLGEQSQSHTLRQINSRQMLERHAKLPVRRRRRTDACCAPGDGRRLTAANADVAVRRLQQQLMLLVVVVVVARRTHKCKLSIGNDGDGGGGSGSSSGNERWRQWPSHSAPKTTSVRGSQEKRRERERETASIR